MGTIKLALGFFVIVGVVIAGFQIAPPLLTNYSFQDDLQNVAMVEGANTQKTNEDIRTDVLRKAKEHDLQLDPKQVTVQDISTPGVKSVFIAVDYSVPVNLPGYSFEMHFNPSSGNKGF
ncbi:MAG: hypothetical protein WCA16_06105 [Candidatus Sulfotelmatobacter sp.]